MTTPDERTRAILDVKDFLRELTNSEATPGVPDGVRQQARRLLRHYLGLAELTLAHKVLPRHFGPVPARGAEPSSGPNDDAGTSSSPTAKV